MVAERAARTLEGETVEITPSPRILKVLARIEFALWQCVAELVDNAFDEFLDIKRADPHWSEPFQVSVVLPSVAEAKSKDATIRVIDNGRGMTLDRVREAVRAGYSGNDPVTKLGLFGMGFNIATARLGSVTRFLTTRTGDAEWVGVEIDLNNIREGFRVPVIRRPKDSPTEHGTVVEISHLEQFALGLTRPQSQNRLRETLGSTYSYLLDSEGFRLSVNDISVKPLQHCVWDETRTVTRAREVIPAIIGIDEHLGERAVCRSCGTWQDLANDVCENCDAADLEVRERRVWGWVGIQRYLDIKEYGVDFLRNGRKILRFDKSLFQWKDPEDPSAQGDTEYPLEIPYSLGRIVGEIHLDHVPVTYTKDSFNTSDKAWIAAVRMIRGDGPLLPRKAKELGYPPNDSPLAKLHRGYRRNDPGKAYLTPGNGKVRVDNREWDERFRKGDPDYQDDSKWWNAVVEHDRIAEEEKRRKVEAEQRGAVAVDDPTREFVDEQAPETTEEAEEIPDGERPLTEADRVEALLQVASPMAELNGEFSVTSVGGKPVNLTAYRVYGRSVVSPDGRRVPVWLSSAKGGFNAFVDMDHPHFANFDDDPADMVLMELAQHMIVRSPGAAATIGTVFAELKDRYLVSHAIDTNRLVPEATQLMRDIQERMVGCVSDNPQRPWQNVLQDYERHVTEQRIISVLKTADTNEAIYSGEYLRLVPPSIVPRVVEEWPDAFFDGRLFDYPYAEVKNQPARRQTVAMITGYLNDVAWLTEAPAAAPREQLIRARLSLQLLPLDLAQPNE